VPQGLELRLVKAKHLARLLIAKREDDWVDYSPGTWTPRKEIEN